MSKFFHISEDGNPRPCQAVANGNPCPLHHDAAHHYRSKDEARAAYADEHKNELFPAFPKKAHVFGLKPSRKKVAQNLMRTNATAAILVSARKSFGKDFQKGQNIAPDEYAVQLESHPNYPVSEMTTYGLEYLQEHGAFSEKELSETVFSSDDANDAVLHFADKLPQQKSPGMKFTRSEALTAILKNPKTHISDRAILQVLGKENVRQQSFEYASNPLSVPAQDSCLRAAIASGRFPTKEAVSGQIRLLADDDGASRVVPVQALVQRSLRYLPRQKFAEVYAALEGQENALDQDILDHRPRTEIPDDIYDRMSKRSALRRSRFEHMKKTFETE